MALPRNAIYSHVTFDGSLDNERTIGEIVDYVRAAANGPVNIHIIRQQEIEEDEKNNNFLGKSYYEDHYTAWIDGNKLWINRRHHHGERRSGDEHHPSRREKERRKRNNRRFIDIGHMPKPLAVVKNEDNGPVA